MLCDGGTAFRTGPDSGGPDYYPDGDDPMFTENPMQYVAKKVGYEILTGKACPEMRAGILESEVCALHPVPNTLHTTLRLCTVHSIYPKHQVTYIQTLCPGP
jgi:hypothetical protein